MLEEKRISTENGSLEGENLKLEVTIAYIMKIGPFAFQLHCPLFSVHL